MRRSFLLLLGVAAATWLQFEVFPGHTYLRSDSQLYLPMLERLAAPGYLSRDLVATHPNLTYSVYDEVTLFLHGAGRMKFETALMLQQVVCRAAAITGVLLLAVSIGLNDALALAVAFLVNLGGTLAGPALHLADPEPVPSAFAFSLALLAAGLFTRDKPLLGGLAGGIALLYQPAVAAPLWGVVIGGFLLRPHLRRLFRPAVTILIVFLLLLANLAQLQPGVANSQALLARLPELVSTCLRYRTPHVWVSLWASTDLLSYLALYVCGIWALTRIWPFLNRQARWFFTLLPLYGVLSVPLSYALLERMRLSLGPALQPARGLLLTVVFSSIACAMAGARAAVGRRRWEASCWFLVVLLIPVKAEVFGFLHATLPSPSQHLDEDSVLAMARWAESSTWGSSTFLFPDSGRELYPGIFRAISRRALWVDWMSGELADDSPAVASEWWARWNGTMEGGFSPRRLQDLLPLPIDYYVLNRSHTLSGIKIAWENQDFVVYDAEDLRRTGSPLRLAWRRPKI